LNDDFAKAGLKSLRAIEGETGSIEAMDGGGVGVPRQTQEFIDNLDAEARTTKETALVVIFNRLFMFHLLITAKEHTAYSEWHSNSTMIDFERRTADSRYDPTADTTNEAAYTKAKADIVELRARESSCSDALETVLRSRSYTGSPEVCSNLSIVAKP
jgi:hypothetical protein